MSTLSNRVLLATVFVISIASYAFTKQFIYKQQRTSRIASVTCCANPQPNHVCVMKTVFGLDSHQVVAVNTAHVPETSAAAIKKALSWVAAAQAPDGGWGAGAHRHQKVRDPHAVATDPATTALVALSLLRTGNTLEDGSYSTQLKKATEYLLGAVENWPASQPYLTTLQGTQPQQKLGQNIDAILTAQFLTNLIGIQPQHAWSERIRKNAETCLRRIEQQQDEDGGWKGGGWAPVLQSALADNVLESAADQGMAVDSNVLRRSKNYQKQNFNTETKTTVTGKAAGVVLYSISSTTRSSAKEAKKAKDIIARAKQEGKLKPEEELNDETLQKAGLAPAEAKELATAYRINQGAKAEAQREDVMDGFGSNGGEEFLSYLMTGESMVMQGGQEWKKWYDMMAARIIAIQNNDGSWNGHHCITSPVFCTAVCILILSIREDLETSLKSF